jgi:riboflavin synthase
VFTGIIEEVGKVKNIIRKGDTALLEIAAGRIMDDVKLGDSIAVNGVCLTVVEFGAAYFKADASDETMRRTSLKSAVPGKTVNLERAMPMNGRFGGHIVQGHVDGTATLLEAAKHGDFWHLRFSLPEPLRKYVADKGSICVDGISLTVSADLSSAFTIAVIPHTYNNTNLSSLTPGDEVNIEIDVLARYIEKLLNSNTKEDKLKKLLEEF